MDVGGAICRAPRGAGAGPALERDAAGNARDFASRHPRRGAALQDPPGGGPRAGIAVPGSTPDLGPASLAAPVWRAADEPARFPGQRLPCSLAVPGGRARSREIPDRARDWRGRGRRGDGALRAPRARGAPGPSGVASSSGGRRAGSGVAGAGDSGAAGESGYRAGGPAVHALPRRRRDHAGGFLPGPEVGSLSREPGGQRAPATARARAVRRARTRPGWRLWSAFDST